MKLSEVRTKLTIKLCVTCVSVFVKKFKRNLKKSSIFILLVKCLYPSNKLKTAQKMLEKIRTRRTMYGKRFDCADMFFCHTIILLFTILSHKYISHLRIHTRKPTKKVVMVFSVTYLYITCLKKGGFHKFSRISFFNMMKYKVPTEHSAREGGKYWGGRLSERAGEKIASF